MKFNRHILAQEYSIQVYYTGVFLLKKVSFSTSTFYALTKQATKRLHWIFCERSHSQSRLRIMKKGFQATFVAADHDSSVSVPFSPRIANIVTPPPRYQNM